jgi:hypothetical protein
MATAALGVVIKRPFHLVSLARVRPCATLWA